MANKNIDGDVNVQFTEASSRQSLETGESVKTLFGKVRKWLSDLKPVAFSGSYSDLANKPTVVNNVTYDSANKSLRKTKDGLASTIVSISMLKTDMELDNVDNTLTQKVDKALEQTGYNLLEITAGTQIVNGVTFTVDRVAGTITANGTATAQVAFVINSNVGLSHNYKGELWSDGSPSGSSVNTYFLNYEDNNGKNVNCYTNEPILLTNTTPPATITRALIYILPAELARMPFQPYAMSNADLTQKALIKEDNNAGGYNITLDKPFTLRYSFYAISVNRYGIQLDQGGDIVSIKSDGIYFNGSKVGP